MLKVTQCFSWISNNVPIAYQLQAWLLSFSNNTLFESTRIQKIQLLCKLGCENGLKSECGGRNYGNVSCMSSLGVTGAKSNNKWTYVGNASKYIINELWYHFINVYDFFYCHRNTILFLFENSMKSSNWITIPKRILSG